MDSLFAIQGKDFVLVAADSTVAQSIVKFKENEDKMLTIDNDKVLCMGGPVGDRVNFGEFVKNNIHLHKYKNGFKLNTAESAEFIRSELAKALREAPQQVSCLLAGIDESGPQLYWIDYMGCKIRCDRTAQGYAAHFLLGLLDNVYKKVQISNQDINLQEGLQMIQFCIRELQTRFLMSQNNFTIKCVDKNGVRVI